VPLIGLVSRHVSRAEYRRRAAARLRRTTKVPLWAGPAPGEPSRCQQAPRKGERR
jgi:hypothetical protein